MDLSSEEVRHIARLARIALTDEETERLRGELSSILGHCQALSAVDTSGVPPTAQSFSLVNVERSDEPRPSQAVSEVLANSPEREGDYIRVRAVLDQGPDG